MGQFLGGSIANIVQQVCLCLCVCLCDKYGAFTINSTIPSYFCTNMPNYPALVFCFRWLLLIFQRQSCCLYFHTCWILLRLHQCTYDLCVSLLSSIDKMEKNIRGKNDRTFYQFIFHAKIFSFLSKYLFVMSIHRNDRN